MSMGAESLTLKRSHEKRVKRVAKSDENQSRRLHRSCAVLLTSGAIRIDLSQARVPRLTGWSWNPGHRSWWLVKYRLVGPRNFSRPFFLSHALGPRARTDSSPYHPVWFILSDYEGRNLTGELS